MAELSQSHLVKVLERRIAIVEEIKRRWMKYGYWPGKHEFVQRLNDIKADAQWKLKKLNENNSNSVA